MWPGVDPRQAWSVWAPPLAVFFVAATGLRAAVERGDWLFALPLAGIVVYVAVTVALLRRRRTQVHRWIERRPRTGWRSVPP